MAENEWGEEQPEPKKKRVPKWVWWTCGSGCLLFVLLAGAAIFLLGSLARRAMDPEHAWAELKEVMPYDQRPAGWDARGTMAFMGIGQYFLTPDAPEGVTLLVQRFHGKPELDAVFEPGSIQNQGVLGFNAIHDPEPGMLTLQGREVRELRFHARSFKRGRDEKEGAGDEDRNAAHMRIDISGKGDIPVFVEVVLPTGEERVSDEQATTLLAPFDLWRGR